MKWTVLYSPFAEARLARLWLNAIDRQAVSRAADLIDTALQQNPQGVGESRGTHRRIYHERPLGVVYSVIEAETRVLVLDIWQYRGPRNTG